MEACKLVPWRALLREPEFIERYRRGDDAACRELVELVGPRIHCILKREWLSQDVCEEILAAVFSKTWQARSKLDATKNVYSYICRIAANELTDHHRARTKRQEALREYVDAGGLDSTEEVDNTTETSAPADSPLSVAVRSAVAKLPPMLRRVLELYVAGKNLGWTQKEMANEGDMNHVAFRVSLGRAIQRLKELLREDGFEFGSGGEA